MKQRVSHTSVNLVLDLVFDKFNTFSSLDKLISSVLNMYYSNISNQLGPPSANLNNDEWQFVMRKEHYKTKVQKNVSYISFVYGTQGLIF